MAAPARTLRELVLAALGAVAAGTERAEELVSDVSARGIDAAGVYRELGVVPRTDYEELELRLAQLEHRVRLLEDDRRSLPSPTP
jgi:polyhydroxyalkanoate synthesis regulator phasin